MLVAGIVFVLIFGIVCACVGLGTTFFKYQQKQQIRHMLRNAEATPEQQRNPDLLKPANDSDALAKILHRFEIGARLTTVLDQAGSTSTPSKLMGSCFITGVVCGLIGYKLHFSLPAQPVGLGAAALGLITPFLLVLKKRSKNISQFEEQLPDALDFLSRSMRAGHGFSVALEMLATDSPDPLGRAFRRVANDLSLGSPMDVGLGKLVQLVPTVDVRFFVSAVLLQQETGGNLGEILTKLSYIIRERFRLRGQVKAVSAHGRVTGLVLLLMPVGVAAFLLLTNPKYLGDMAANHIGKLMIWGAVLGQIVGYFVIKKIIAIKV